MKKLIVLALASLALARVGYAITVNPASNVTADSDNTAGTILYRDNSGNALIGTLTAGSLVSTGTISTSAGSLSVSTGTSAGVTNMRFRGALDAKPSSANEGDIYWDIVEKTLCISTATSSNGSAWLKANKGNLGGSTTQAAWTTY
jgi:hypothetical protein